MIGIYRMYNLESSRVVFAANLASMGFDLFFIRSVIVASRKNIAILNWDFF